MIWKAKPIAKHQGNWKVLAGSCPVTAGDERNSWMLNVKMNYCFVILREKQWETIYKVQWLKQLFMQLNINFTFMYYRIADDYDAVLF